MSTPVVWFVVPAGYDDPDRVSGGNVYDQRVEAELRLLDWDVRTVQAGTGESAGVDPFDGIPDGSLVLVDGLVAITVPAALDAAADRLRIVALVHMVAEAFVDADRRAVEAERTALPRAICVIATSQWLRDELARRRLSRSDRMVVATPGSDDAAEAVGTPSGGSLLCVGVIAPHKGQDVLVEALAELASRPGWTCTFVGSVTTDRGFAERVAGQAMRGGVSERIRWRGVLTSRELETAYAGADVLVAPSRTESYGIAVGDALRRGIPVIASRVGGIPEAAHPRDAVILVPPEDPRPLAAALRRWVDDPGLRGTMSAAAKRSARSRRGWSDTARTIHSTLVGLP